MRGVLILNPSSGRGKGKRLIEGIRRTVAHLSIELDIWPTTCRGEATHLAQRAVDGGAELVAACGGDGTLNEVLQGISGTNVAFAAVPCGTGNDFCRTIGFGSDWQAALHAIAEGRIVPIDIGVCRSQGESRRFLNVAGCGFDVEVAERINNGFRLVKGTLAYICGVLGAFARFKSMPMSITIDGAKIESQVMLCAIANAKSYGGAMLIAPHAIIDDGRFEIVVIEEVTKSEFIRTFPKVFKGRHLDHPKVKTFSGTSVRIQTIPGASALLDGEIFGQTLFEFEILPGALSCIVPASFETAPVVS